MCFTLDQDELEFIALVTETSKVKIQAKWYGGKLSRWKLRLFINRDVSTWEFDKSDRIKPFDLGVYAASNWKGETITVESMDLIRNLSDNGTQRKLKAYIKELV